MAEATERINVTKVFLPPLEEYQEYLAQIWANSQITNQGPMLLAFEARMKEYLNVENFHFVANGTIALQIALRGLGVTDGEVITTPFSYVATTSAILWERCTPVFVDIEPNTFCIDVNKIKSAITDKTKAILVVHVFGYPCNVEEIERIAKEHRLKVIYDGAHAMGAAYKEESLLSYGDITTCSFHATKLMHTIEGGAVIVKDKEVSDQIELMKRFGHVGDEHYALGINAKSSEFNAAMGLVNFKYLPSLINGRREVSGLYDELLSGIHSPPEVSEFTNNFAYYPIVFQDEEQLTRVVDLLNQNNIFPRRYFYPSLNELPYLEARFSCPISESIARTILCLPLYAGLAHEDVRRICALVKEAVHG